jgi:hypothetical protein
MRHAGGAACDPDEWLTALTNRRAELAADVAADMLLVAEPIPDAVPQDWEWI